MKKQLIITIGLGLILGACSSNKPTMEVEADEMLRMHEGLLKPSKKVWSKITTDQLDEFLLTQRGFYSKKAQLEERARKCETVGYVAYEKQIDTAARLGDTAALEKIEDDLHALKSSVGGAINRSRAVNGSTRLVAEAKYEATIALDAEQDSDDNEPTEAQLLSELGLE